MWDAVLNPRFKLTKTQKFLVVDSQHDSPAWGKVSSKDVDVKVNWNCRYTRQIIESSASRRSWCHLRPFDSEPALPGHAAVVQVADFENIIWESVVSNKHSASSYLVRKGLSRKAQLALQIRRYVAKHPDSILSRAVPESAIIETWNAFEDMKIDVGFGISTSFDIPSMQRAPLRQRLQWTLGELFNTHFENKPDSTTYILKPSVTNKGADIALVRDWEDLLDVLEDSPQQREWVLQKYISNPLLLSHGRKFHLRVYVLCVGALRVFVFQDILLLIAAHRYDPDDLTDIYAHLTNTARAAEKEYFDEKRFVKTLRDLPTLLREAQPGKHSEDSANAFEKRVRDQVNSITAELFNAYENEYSIFCPMANCFELFGLDYLVDCDGNVSLLEVNPGPDFVQTGDRLRNVIVQLWEQTFRVVVDTPVLWSSSFSSFDQWWSEIGQDHVKDFRMVYSKEWSVSKLQGETGLTLR